MDSKDWELLVALAEKKSIAKAASELYLSQPALTYRLKRIESEFDVELFIRSNRGIVFTSAGERLLSYAGKVMNLYKEIAENVRNTGGRIEGSVLLGTPSSLARRILPTFCVDFSEEFPGVSLSIITDQSDLLMEKMHSGKLIMSLVRGNHPWNEHDVLLFNEPIYLVSKDPIVMEELPNRPYIAYRADPTLQTIMDKWWMENFTCEPKKTIHVDGSQTCMQFLEAGMGFSLITAIRVEEDSTLHRQAICDRNGNPYLRPARLLYTREAARLDSYRALIDAICARFRQPSVAE